mgnify:CR=1 FL=1
MKMHYILTLLFVLLTPSSVISSTINLSDFAAQEITDLKEKGFLVRNNDQLTYLNNQMQKVWEKEITGLTGTKGFVSIIDEKIFVIQFIKESKYNAVKICELDFEGVTNEFLIPLFSDIEEIITCSMDGNNLTYLAKHYYPNTEYFVLGKVLLKDQQHITKFIDIKKAKAVEYAQLMQMLEN